MNAEQLEAKERISKDRTRTNLFRKSEQYMLSLLCTLIPKWMTPNVLTAIGFIGSFIILAAFILARDNRYILSIAVLGFAIQWFGDSLDGRIAYYRNTPRKWFGFTLDMTMDWLSTIIIGIGFFFYLPEWYWIFVFTFITGYGWTMIIALLKYQVTGKYQIDSGLLGPTELRIILCLIIVGEVVFPGFMKAFTLIANAVIYIMNSVDFYQLLQLGNKRDEQENETITQ